jgi:tetratricopeptide (TPR) repeat protein
MAKDNVPFGLVSTSRTPFVGREVEMAALDRALAEVETTKQARVVTLVSAPGLGKSRLIHEFVVKHRGGSALLPRIYRGTARDADSSYGMFGRLLRMRFGLVDGMDHEALKSAVREQVSKVVGDRKVGDVVYFLGQFLEVPFEESPLTRAIADDPRQGRQLRRAVVKSFFEADAAHSPLCLVFDDLHAAHADSLELLRYLVEYLTGPILMICAARSDLIGMTDDWARAGEERHTLVEVPVLSEASARELASVLLAPAASESGTIPPLLLDTTLAFAGGNPTLLEQMVRLFHDRGVLEEEEALTEVPRWRVHLERLDQAAPPLTVDGAIQSRIASLSGSERRVLELAATVGSVFWPAALVPMLRAGAEAPELWEVGEDAEPKAVADTLRDLERRDFVLRVPDSSLQGSDEYVFKHNKEREAIRGQINPATQKRHHAIFANWLEQQGLASGTEEAKVLLAEHRERAGDPVGAGLAYLDAGDLCRAAYASQTACEHYQRGLELVGDGHVGRRIDALHNYGDVLVSVGKVDDALSMFREMLALAYQLDIKSKGGAAHNRIGRLHRDSGALEEASRHLEAAMRLFTAASDERGVASSTDDLGKLAWLKGDYKSALELLRDGLAKRRRLGDRRSIALSFNNLGIVLTETGDFGQAFESFQQALSIRRDIGDLPGVVQALNNLGVLAEERGDYQQSLATFEEALDVAKQIGDRNRIALVLVNVGDALHKSGAPDRAISVLSLAEEQLDELGDKLGLADALRAMGEAYLARKDLVKARDCISRCVDIFATVRSKVQLGIALRTLGEITAAGGWGASHTKSAREYYARSVSIFEQTGNELELAKSYSAFTRFIDTQPELRADPAVIADQRRMGEAAATILGRLRRGGDARPRPSLPSIDPEAEL